MVLPFRLSTQTRRCVSAILIPRPLLVVSCAATTIVIPPRRPPILPISCNTVQRKCLEIVQYRVKFSKSSISLSSRHGLRDDAELQKGLTVMAVLDRRGYDPIKRRRPTTFDTLRTYDENSRSCSGFHSRQFRETDEDGGRWKLEASPILSSLRPKPGIVRARKRVGDDGREWSWVPSERWKRKRGGGSGLARTPGGVDGVAQHRPEYYGLIKPS
ncbi:hypothetical protein G5I_04279 [Acromyrmex echinatior]|uniref:Uncharacterized protein n=1 Tax=Acromyrmex echinatior TaxID=103372 RepID=F4WF72_ACREC|nr:hypothetical protein G5I_04279 [Acromyrmex echinatior]